jgi:tetratricopeptide (TPR) repeat protein
VQFQAVLILRQIDGYLQAGKLAKALSECERAIQIAPDLASAYNYRGLVHDSLGELAKARCDYQAALRLDPSLQNARDNLLSLEQDLEEDLQLFTQVQAQTQASQTLNKADAYLDADELEKAMADYQAAVRLDPGLENAWDNLIVLEEEFEEQFLASPAKAHLDQALEYAQDEQPALALDECALARPLLPDIAMAYNYLGLILQGLEQIGPAIDAYLAALWRNPRYYAARENLANARVKLEEEQYHQMAISIGEGYQAQADQVALPDASDWQKAKMAADDQPVPGWVYTHENAYWLWGWLGHRTRPGRTGYDPFDSYTEEAHVEGVIIWQVLTGRFRTCNPLSLLLMTLAGLILCFPLIFGGMFILHNDWASLALVALMSPAWVVGAALLIAVFLSLAEGETRDE